LEDMVDAWVARDGGTNNVGGSARTLYEYKNMDPEMKGSCEKLFKGEASTCRVDLQSTWGNNSANVSVQVGSRVNSRKGSSQTCATAIFRTTNETNSSVGEALKRSLQSGSRAILLTEQEKEEDDEYRGLAATDTGLKLSPEGFPVEELGQRERGIFGDILKIAGPAVLGLATNLLDRSLSTDYVNVILGQVLKVAGPVVLNLAQQLTSGTRELQSITSQMVANVGPTPQLFRLIKDVQSGNDATIENAFGELNKMGGPVMVHLAAQLIPNGEDYARRVLLY